MLLGLAHWETYGLFGLDVLFTGIITLLLRLRLGAILTVVVSGCTLPALLIAAGAATFAQQATPEIAAHLSLFSGALLLAAITAPVSLASSAQSSWRAQD